MVGVARRSCLGGLLGAVLALAACGAPPASTPIIADHTAVPSVFFGPPVPPPAASALLVAGPPAPAVPAVDGLAQISTSPLSGAVPPTAPDSPPARDDLDRLARRPGRAPSPQLTLPPVPDAHAALRVANVPILMYHYISTVPAVANSTRRELSISPDLFRQHLAYLAAHGYTTVTLDDVYAYLARGTPLPLRPVVLTFDDGYRDAFTAAFPLLRAFKQTGTFFVVSSFIDRGNPSYLTWPMVNTMARAGMRIESHTRTHTDLRYRTPADLDDEIFGANARIAAVTGRWPHFFCYPGGEYDVGAIAAVRRSGMWAALTTHYGAHQTLKEAMIWSRIRVHGGMSASELGLALQAITGIDDTNATTTGVGP